MNSPPYTITSTTIKIHFHYQEHVHTHISRTSTPRHQIISTTNNLHSIIIPTHNHHTTRLIACPNSTLLIHQFATLTFIKIPVSDTTNRSSLTIRIHHMQLFLLHLEILVLSKRCYTRYWDKRGSKRHTLFVHLVRWNVTYVWGLPRQKGNSL